MVKLIHAFCFVGIFLKKPQISLPILTAQNRRKGATQTPWQLIGHSEKTSIHLTIQNLVWREAPNTSHPIPIYFFAHGKG